MRTHIYVIVRTNKATAQTDIPRSMNATLDERYCCFYD